MSNVLIVLSALAALAGISALYFYRRFQPRLQVLRERAKLVVECGYLSPPPTDEAHRGMVRFAKFFVDHFVGKVEATGHEKLATMPGPFVLAFNHGSLLDVAIAPVVLNRKARFPAALGVTSLAGGLVGAKMSEWGVFTVDLDNGHAAFNASVKVLTSGDDANIEVIFPEAWTNMDGTVKKFKTGAVRMVQEASVRLGRPVNLIPGYMHYGRYPGKWILKLPMALQWLTPLVFAFYYARGVKVVIGDPIPSTDLPSDPREATEILRQKVLALKPSV